MQHKSFRHMACPIARSLDQVGEWWSVLILRDAFYGYTRFDEFLTSLDIAPNTLTKRLKALVEHGMLERQRYSERPPRDEYLLTQRGRDFRPVLQALLAWGNRHLAPEGASIVYAQTASGVPADPIVVDRVTGLPMDIGFETAPGPAASEAVRRKIAGRRPVRAPGQSPVRALGE